MTPRLATPPARRRQRGQSLAELGIAIVLLVLLVMGILEFGRAFMIANLITHATRDGARAAAVLPVGSRTAQGIIASTAAIQARVRNEIASVVDARALNVVVEQPTIGGIPMVRVTVSGTVPYLFNMPGVGSSFTVTRSLTFRDEGR